MNHPELMLSSSGIQYATQTARRLASQYKNLFPNFPDSSLLVEKAVLPPDSIKPSERAAMRELPYVLWRISDSPTYWKLDPLFAEALVATDAPEDPDIREFRLPFPAIWVDAPPILQIFNSLTGMHDLEGFYLCEDYVPSRSAICRLAGAPDRLFREFSLEFNKELDQVFIQQVDKDPLAVLEPAILVLMVGRPIGNASIRQYELGGSKLEVVYRDDALMSFWIFLEDPMLNRETRSPFSSFIINFILALQSDYVERSTVTPTPPKSPKKLAKAARRGESFAPYTILRLGSRRTETRSRAKAQGPQRDRVIRGYWNHYWVLEDHVNGAVVLQRQNREGKKTLCKIRKWLQPQIIGNPPPKAYLVSTSGCRDDSKPQG